MVIIKTPEQVEGIRRSCHLLAKVLREVAAFVKPGVTTRQIDQLAEKLIVDAGGKPAFKGYRAVPGGVAFPSTICASINEEVVHGPAIGDKPLKEGDIIGLDLGIDLDGYFSDMAVTVAVGKISEEATELMKATEESLNNGIAQIKPGNRIRDISAAIENTIKPYKLGIVRDFVGHGVGLQVHEDPRVPNYVDRRMRSDMELVLKEGMVLAIEPMITMGGESVSVLDDGWTVVTDDGSLSAHFEHTVAVTKDGHEILTV